MRAPSFFYLVFTTLVLSCASSAPDPGEEAASDAVSGGTSARPAGVAPTDQALDDGTSGTGTDVSAAHAADGTDVDVTDETSVENTTATSGSSASLGPSMGSETWAEQPDGGTLPLGDAAPSTSPPQNVNAVVPFGEGFSVAVQLASELDENAPSTVGIVEWSVDVTDLTSAHIEFGLTSDYGMLAPVNLSESGYRTLLLGLKPTQIYHFRIIASDGTTSYASDDYTLDTGAATNAVEIGSFEVLNEEKRERGFTVASYWSGTGSAVAFILDADGEIVWAYDTGISGGIARARMSEDGQHMWVITASNSGGALQRMSMDGLSGETYAQTVGSHDITSVSGSTMAYIDYGESDCDSIFEIELSGETREVWDSQQWFSSIGSGGGAGGRCHGNALRYSAAEDVYTFSDVSTDVVVVGRAGEFSWGLADRVSGGVEAWGGRNHGHHLLDDSFVIFANTGGDGGASAVVEYTLEGEEIWRYDSGDGSANLGDVQRLPGGNTLVTFSNDSVVHEVTSDKELVLRWTGAPSTRIGYILWRQSLYGPSPDIHM